MPRYMVQSTHTPEECLQTLDELSGQGPEALRQWNFACATGDHSNHTDYAILDAPNEPSALSQMGQTAQRNAQVAEVGQLTQEQIQAFHQN